MLTKEKPRLGLLAIMHGLYDESQPEIPKQQTVFANDVIRQLGDIADIDFPEIGKDRAATERIVKSFNDKNYDGIIVVNLLYSPGMRIVQAFKQNRLPVLIANIQPLPDVTRDWNWSLLTTNQGIHGIQDTSNMLMRLGVNRTVVTDDWKSPEFKAIVNDWAAAAYTVRRLKSVKAAVFNKMQGMGDILGDEVAYFRKFGIEIAYESIGLVVKVFDEVTDAEVDAYIAEDKKNFEIDPALPEESHRYAARLQAAYEKFLDSRGYEAFSPNFTVYEDDGMRLRQLPILAASNMLAKGYGYSAEGDVHAMALTIIGHLLVGDPHFTEMYSLDFGRDSTMLSHMGEGNWKVARRDRPVRLIDRPLDIGNAENPPTPVYSAQPGESTIATLVPVAGDEYRLIVSHGEVLDTDEIPGIPMNYSFFRPDTGIRKSMDDWLKYGGTHHQILWMGDQRRRLKNFSEIIGMTYIEV
jgi:L-arabinose isomerase